MTATTTWCHFRLKGETEHRTAEVIKNLGIRFALREEDGTEHTVPRSAILSTWDEAPAQEGEAPAITVGSLAEQAAALMEATTPKQAPVDDGIPRVELKSLCIDFGIEPRIARRRLRKAFGQVGTGTRWAWALNSPELEQVKTLLAATPAITEEPSDE